MKVGVLGASGYAGVELMRLSAAHPHFDLSYAGAHSHEGEVVGDLTPSLACAYGDLSFGPVDPQSCQGLDLVFCALPHGASQSIMEELLATTQVVVDLGADFRLKNPDLYPKWYGSKHQVPDLLSHAIYGLPELFRAQMTSQLGSLGQGSKAKRKPGLLIAAPGCYPTASALGLAPFLRAGAVETSGIIVDAASGVSGAGRAPSEALHFGHVSENFSAYGLLTHRHTPEIEQALGAQVLFTPHLAPMSRGILATCYARVKGAYKTQDAIDELSLFYANEPFVKVSTKPPSTKETLGSNVAKVSAQVDERTGWLVSLCALDNLGKGAAGQAMQCANIAFGLPETTGLSLEGMYP